MIQLNFVTPDKKILTGQSVHELYVPAFTGELNILPGHAPTMTTLVPGVVRYQTSEGTKHLFAVSWGYCQIQGSEVSILAETAVTRDEIEVAKVEAEVISLQKALSEKPMSDDEWNDTQIRLGRSKAEVLVGNSKA